MKANTRRVEPQGDRCFNNLAWSAEEKEETRLLGHAPASPERRMLYATRVFQPERPVDQRCWQPYNSKEWEGYHRREEGWRKKESKKRERGANYDNNNKKILFAERNKRNPLPAKIASTSSSCAWRTSGQRKSFASMKSEQALRTRTGSKSHSIRAKKKKNPLMVNLVWGNINAR